jgi:hypothetical protein
MLHQVFEKKQNVLEKRKEESLTVISAITRKAPL